MNNKTTYYKKIRKKLLNRAKEYYENNIERFWEQAKNKYRELYKEKKIRKENMEETDIKIENKQRVKEYLKN